VRVDKVRGEDALQRRLVSLSDGVVDHLVQFAQERVNI
jgi:hypothetical protein